MTTTIVNPIIPGFAPDPSIINVDGTFFLVNSTFHIFPGLPIYASKNLKSWTHIGHAINRREQLPLKDAYTGSFPLDTGEYMVSTGGLFAPTIRHHNGTFYVICTNCWTNEEKDFKVQNFYVTCSDIWSGKWSDPINYEWKGIDPSLFFDDDGKVYVQGNWLMDRMKQPSATIKQSEIEIETGKLLTEPKEIWGGFAKYDTEGPHMYKKDGYYYLLVAEGGTFEHHMLSIGRSKSIWGPFESCGHNPVLTADGKDEYIQNTGHGDMVEDNYGQWWAVCLAVRNRGDSRFPLGRETSLTPVSWPVGEFPTFTQPRISIDVPDSKTLQLEPLAVKEDPRVGEVYIRDAVLENYTISPDGSSISMLSSEADVSVACGTCSFVGRRQRSLACTATVSLKCESQQTGTNLRAGLALYKDDFRYAQVYYNYASGAVEFQALSKVQGPLREAKAAIEPAASLSFKIVATELKYEFSYLKDDEWIVLGTVDTLEMSCRDMTGTIFGVFAAGVDGVKCAFENFKIE